TSSRIRPVSRPEYEYDLPTSADESFRFQATVAVQPKIEPAEWTTLEVPAADPVVPDGAIREELDRLRDSVAELAPVDDRPALEGDTLVVDLVSDSGQSERDFVVELGAGRLTEELEEALVGMRPGETKDVVY